MEPFERMVSSLRLPSLRGQVLIALSLFPLLALSACSGSSTQGDAVPEGEARQERVEQVPTADEEVEETPDWLPGVKQMRIPFDEERRRQMAAYSGRHYGDANWRLGSPKLIVQHFAVTSTVDSIYNTFANNSPDPSFGELPNVCTHFAVDDKGKPVQFVSLKTRCRHVVGLNHRSIGIEHVGYADSDVLDNPEVMEGSLELTQRLRCTYGLPVRNVIGHNESLDSPYYEEKVDEFKGQTHSDFTKASMDIYRDELRKLGPCD